MTDLKQSGKTVNGQEVALNMRKDTRCFSSAVYVYTLRYRQKKRLFNGDSSTCRTSGRRNKTRRSTDSKIMHEQSTEINDLNYYHRVKSIKDAVIEIPPL